MATVLNRAACLFALRREARPFLRRFAGHRLASSPFPAWRCDCHLVVEAGIGTARTEQALQWLFATSDRCLDVVISAGFVGALRDNLRVGDVVVADAVMDATGRRWPTTWPTGDVPLSSLHREAVLTMPHLVAEPEAKRGLGESHRAAVVDMESAAIARWCQERGLPFGCVRVVSDDLATPLSPQLVSLLAGGRVSLPRLLRTLAGSPRLAAELWRLARDTDRAAWRLGAVLSALIRHPVGRNRQQAISAPE